MVAAVEKAAVARAGWVVVVTARGEALAMVAWMAMVMVAVAALALQGGSRCQSIRWVGTRER